MEFPIELQLSALDLVAAGTLDGVTVKLFTNDFEPGPETVVADFTEATFSGYADVDAVANGDSFRNSEGKWTRLTARVQFDHSGGAVTEMVFGFYVVIPGAPATYVGAHRFEEPIGMATIADAISFIIGWEVGVTASVFKQ